MPVFADLDLARRLERTEGHGSAMFVEAHARVDRSSNATWRRFGKSVYAMFDGVDSPITQTFGLLEPEDATPELLTEIEAFFKERRAAVSHEVSPLAGIATAELLHARGYKPIEFTSVLYREPGVVPAPANSNIEVRLIDPAKEGDLWAETAARGWAPEQPDLMEFLRNLGRISAARVDPLCFLATLNGQPAGAAGMSIHEGVAHFAGASTVPEMRRQGLQYALLAARMHLAIERGCTLATMGAAPGSASQRNAERHGFRIAYTRTKWQL